jgi:hypothetical protein
MQRKIIGGLVTFALVVGGNAALGQTPPGEPAGAGSVELLEPGDLPRQVLRYDLTRAAEAELVLQTDVEASAGPGPREVMPRMVLPLTLRADSVAEGHAQVQYSSGPMTVEARPGSTNVALGAMRQQANDLPPVEGTVVISDTGRELTRRRPDVAASPQAHEQLERTGEIISDLQAVLPDEPIGIGGRWTVESAVQSGGIAMTRTLAYTLQEVDGQTLTLHVEASFEAPAQNMAMPGAPPDLNMQLLELTGTGEGTLRMSLDSLASEMDLLIHVNMRIESQQLGQKVSLNPQTWTRIRVSEADQAE